jgi:hypothetical protein
LTTWFLNLSIDEYNENKKHKVQISNPRLHETHLEGQKPKKSSRMPSRRWESRKTNKLHEKRQNEEKNKEKLKFTNTKKL